MDGLPELQLIDAEIMDQYCDDINNNLDCSYDGGDCCGCNINTDYCTECQCLDPNGMKVEQLDIKQQQKTQLYYFETTQFTDGS